MVIKRSSSLEVAGLLQDLQTGDAVARETAVARLAVIGTRAVDGLLAVLAPAAAPEVKAAALSALEAIGDPRAVDPACAMLESGDPAVTLSAAGVLRRALDSPRGTEVLDRLAAVALDPTRPDRPRLAALEALGSLSPAMVAPIWKKLQDDRSVAVRGAAAGTGPVPEMEPVAALEAAAGGALPDDPGAVRRWLSANTSALSLSVLHRLVEAIAARERSAGEEAGRAAWMTARAAVHVALAARESRVALYDLRETIERESRVPVEMLSALEQIGDVSCLEPIAAAYSRLCPGAAADLARPAGDEGAWWRGHLARAFRAIASRERLTERHEVTRRIRARWPEAAVELIGLKR